MISLNAVSATPRQAGLSICMIMLISSSFLCSNVGAFSGVTFSSNNSGPQSRALQIAAWWIGPGVSSPVSHLETLEVSVPIVFANSVWLPNPFSIRRALIRCPISFLILFNTYPLTSFYSANFARTIANKRKKCLAFRRKEAHIVRNEETNVCFRMEEMGL